MPLILACFRHTFRTHFGEAPPDDVWIAGIGTPLLTQLRNLAGDDALALRMADTYRQYQDTHHDELLRRFPAVPETLAGLRAAGLRIGVVTSKMPSPARRGLRQAGLLELIDVLIDAESTPRHKPDPAPVLLALERLGGLPDETVFVGDAPVDIAAGRAAGVRTIAALCGPFSRERLEQEQPDAVVAEVREVPAVLRSWNADRSGPPYWTTST